MSEQEQRLPPTGTSLAELSRRDRWIAYAIFSGLAVVLVLGFAVIVHPPLIDTFRGVWPLLAIIGFASTVGGFWWLWWRPR